MKKYLAKIFALLVVAGGLYTVVEVDFSEETIPKYSRSEFKHWIDEDKDCQDTRQEVLIRDSIKFGDGPGQLLVLSENGCRVVSGLWVDPYSNEQFTNPRDLDVDHLVPLKNAWDSGAHAWDDEKREEYANYLGNDYHLIAVKARENRRKGAKGPEGYLPPNEPYQCEYVELWESVKEEWGLFSPDNELLAIKEACQ